mgnify:CR=1 FL=1
MYPTLDCIPPAAGGCPVHEAALIHIVRSKYSLLRQEAGWASAEVGGSSSLSAAGGDSSSPLAATPVSMALDFPLKGALWVPVNSSTENHLARSCGLIREGAHPKWEAAAMQKAAEQVAAAIGVGARGGGVGARIVDVGGAAADRAGARAAGVAVGALWAEGEQMAKRVNASVGADECVRLRTPARRRACLASVPAPTEQAPRMRKGALASSVRGRAGEIDLQRCRLVDPSWAEGPYALQDRPKDDPSPVMLRSMLGRCASCAAGRCALCAGTQHSKAWGTSVHPPVHLPIWYALPRLRAFEQQRVACEAKTDDFSRLVPQGKGMRYMHSDEASYYRQYSNARYSVTMAKAGVDSLRHYEILAAGSIPFFVGSSVLQRRPLTMFAFPRSLVAEAMQLPGVPSEAEVAKEVSAAAESNRSIELHLQARLFPLKQYCSLQARLLNYT